MKRSEPEPMNVPGFEGFHRPLTLVTYSISTPLTESAMMSEFIMVNYSQNECSCQHLSSGYLGELSELGGSPPVPCFGKLPELGCISLHLEQFPYSSAITKEKESVRTASTSWLLRLTSRPEPAFTFQHHCPCPTQ